MNSIEWRHQNNMRMFLEITLRSRRRKRKTPIWLPNTWPYPCKRFNNPMTSFRHTEWGENEESIIIQVSSIFHLILHRIKLPNSILADFILSLSPPLISLLIKMVQRDLKISNFIVVWYRILFFTKKEKKIL